jgi:hypothetical protein
MLGHCPALHLPVFGAARRTARSAGVFAASARALQRARASRWHSLERPVVRRGWWRRFHLGGSDLAMVGGSASYRPSPARSASGVASWEPWQRMPRRAPYSR